MSKSKGHQFKSLSHLISGMVLAVSALVASPVLAQGLDASSRDTLSNFTVSESVLNKVLMITQNAMQQGIKTNSSLNLSNTTVSIDDLANTIKNNPRLIQIIKAAGMSSREFILGDLALMQSAMVAKGGSEASIVQQLVGKPSDANVAFYKQHKTQVNNLISMANGESANHPDMQLSAKDKQQLAQMKKMVQSGKFKECLKISMILPSVTYPFVSVSATSHYNVPNAKLEPGTLTKSGKLLEDLSANVSDQVPSDALMKLGREIELQEGHDPIEVTSRFKSAMNTMNKWLQANCKPKGNEKGANNTASLHASAPKTVQKLISDAPGVMFGQLSANDAAILSAAEGIQVGEKAGQAHISVIFDPNGPYAAKLYTLLKKDHPDLAVRWVPIAYMTKTSKPLTSLLIHSHSPQQDLNTDLADYNFSKQHGGIVPGHERAKTLPSEQQHLSEAMKKWGGYTPMIIFQDDTGRWLKTGGSSSKVLNSVLARAAK